VPSSYDFCAPKTGRIESCDFLDEFKSHPWVNKVVYYKKPGDKVVGLDTAVPDWYATMMCEHSIIGLCGNNHR
jgi:hypothetical protein